MYCHHILFKHKIWWFKLSIHILGTGVKVLSLYAKAAYTISNKELKCSELSFEKQDMNLGITDMSTYTDFPADELQILNTINHVYGYEELKYLKVKEYRRNRKFD